MRNYCNLILSFKNIKRNNSEIDVEKTNLIDKN